MIEKNNCKKGLADIPFSANHFFFNLRHVISTLGLIIGLQYSALGIVNSKFILKDSTVESISKSTVVSDISTLALTSLETVSISPPPSSFFCNRHYFECYLYSNFQWNY